MYDLEEETGEVFEQTPSKKLNIARIRITDDSMSSELQEEEERTCSSETEEEEERTSSSETEEEEVRPSLSKKSNGKRISFIDESDDSTTEPEGVQYYEDDIEEDLEGPTKTTGPTEANVVTNRTGESFVFLRSHNHNPSTMEVHMNELNAILTSMTKKPKIVVIKSDDGDDYSIRNQYNTHLLGRIFIDFNLDMLGRYFHQFIYIFI